MLGLPCGRCGEMKEIALANFCNRCQKYWDDDLKARRAKTALDLAEEEKRPNASARAVNQKCAGCGVMTTNTRYKIPYCEGCVDKQGLKTLPSGSTRTNIDTHRYDLISPWGLMRLAERYAKGAVKHGDRDWEAGQPEGEVINHMDKHMTLYKQGDRTDDHIAAVAWGAFALLHFDELKKRYPLMKVKAAPPVEPADLPKHLRDLADSETSA